MLAFLHLIMGTKSTSKKDQRKTSDMPKIKKNFETPKKWINYKRGNWKLGRWQTFKVNNGTTENIKCVAFF